MDFNYEIINEEFKNKKVCVVIIKFSTITTFKAIVEFDLYPNWKFLNLSNNKFEPISIFRMKL